MLAGSLLVVGLAVGWGLSWLGTKPTAPAEVPVAEAVTPAAGTETRAPGPQAPRRPAKIEVDTPEPGFLVLIDGEPVRDAQGQLVLTPCEITLAPGRHSLVTAKDGWTDIVRIDDFSTGQKIVAAPEYQPFEQQTTLWKAPYLSAAVGQPIPVASWNFSGRVLDPFVSANGLTLLAAAEGPDGRGIYTSTRATPYDEWEPPVLLLLSRGVDLPGSPSLTDEGRSVAYTVPGKVGRVWGLTRNEGEEAYDAKNPLHFAEEKGDPEWPVAQLSADGLRLYYHSIKAERGTNFLATRDQADFNFMRGRKVTLPGKFPLLSADELRQYEFDGQRLWRAERAKLGDDFGPLQSVCEITLPDFQPGGTHRRVWVTDDEQWLYYTPQWETPSRLTMVRLSLGPQRGLLVRGRALPPRSATPDPELAEMTEPEPAEEAPPQPVTPENDSTAPPADYPAFQARFMALLAERNETAARELIAAQQDNPPLQRVATLLEWDTADLDVIDAFWKEVEKSAVGLQPGDKVRIGPNQWDLVSYAEGQFSLKLKDKTSTKAVRELAIGDLTALLDATHDKNDLALQRQIGIFLHYAGPSYATSAKARLQRAKAESEEFRERLSQRQVKVIELDLADQRFSRALSRIEALVQADPKSPSAAQAEKFREEIYQFVKWDIRNPDRWLQTEPGTYTLGAAKSPGTLLVSPAEFGDFVFSCEWMTTSATGQGGVYFNYPGTGKPLDRAFKIQLANDAGVIPDKYCTGALFDHYPPAMNAAKPGGQWNTLRVSLKGDALIVHVNGQQVLETIASDEDIPRRGFVAVDGELGGITYRKLLVVGAEE